MGSPEVVLAAIKTPPESVKGITLGCLEMRMRLRILDDGRGLPADSAVHGMGLRIMVFRADMIHAVPDLHPEENGGTLVEVSLTDNLAAPADHGRY